MTTETSNARGELPARYACSGPEGTFWTDDATLANKLIAAAFDRDEWTVTDTQNPTAAAPQPPSAPVGVERIEAVLHLVYMDHPDYRLTTTMIHDMAAAVVQSLAPPPADPEPQSSRPSSRHSDASERR